MTIYSDTPAKNLYAILGLKRTASTEEIRSSFRQLALIYHPDINKKPNAEVQFKIFLNAYETLSNPSTKKEYDSYLKTSSIYKTNIKTATSSLKRKKNEFKNRSPQKRKVSPISTLEYLKNQFNYILWELEDLMNSKTERYDQSNYSGLSLSQWLVKILAFIDKWILTPQGYQDYYFEARRIERAHSPESILDSAHYQIHQPYVNLSDYFYNVRKRMNNFLAKVNENDMMKTIEESNLKILDAVFEVQNFCYHYLGGLKSATLKKQDKIPLYQFKNKFFSNETRSFLK